MATHFEIDDGFHRRTEREGESTGSTKTTIISAKKLRRRGVDIEDLVAKAQAFQVAVPSWGVGTGGTRFARFPGPGEPRGYLRKA